MLPLKIENFFKWHHLCLYQFFVKGLFFPKEIFYDMQCHPAWPRALFEVLHHIEFSSSSRVVQGEQGHARILLLLLHGHYQSVNWSLSTCEQGLDQLSINCQPNQWSIASLNSEEQGHSVASAVFANSTRIHPIFTFPLYDVHCTPVLKRDILLFLRCVAF